MSGFFQVDLDALRQFITTLGQSGDQMEAALDAMKSADATQIGTKDLDDAAHDFQDTWRYGLGQLQDKIKDTDSGVEQAHRAYQEVEQGLRNSLQQLGGAVTGTGS
jgi:uncharacterized protein YukE